LFKQLQRDSDAAANAKGNLIRVLYQASNARALGLDGMVRRLCLAQTRVHELERGVSKYEDYPGSLRGKFCGRYATGKPFVIPTVIQAI